MVDVGRPVLMKMTREAIIVSIGYWLYMALEVVETTSKDCRMGLVTALKKKLGKV